MTVQKCSSENSFAYGKGHSLYWLTCETLCAQTFDERSFSVFAPTRMCSVCPRNFCINKRILSSASKSATNSGSRRNVGELWLEEIKNVFRWNMEGKGGWVDVENFFSERQTSECLLKRHRTELLLLPMLKLLWQQFSLITTVQIRQWCVNK